MRVVRRKADFALAVADGQIRVVVLLVGDVRERVDERDRLVANQRTRIAC